jgi:hypothetical protein
MSANDGSRRNWNDRISVVFGGALPLSARVARQVGNINSITPKYSAPPRDTSHGPYHGWRPVFVRNTDVTVQPIKSGVRVHG